MSVENQRTILLVEDEAITAMAGKITLEKYGNKVMTAHTGEEAVKTVKKTPGIDLVLMDINLGAGIDGTEAAEIILRERDLPVVFLSAHTEPEMVARTEKITSYGFVVKQSGHTVLDASIKMAFKLFEAKAKEKEKESQREAALEALRESEAKYRQLVECLNEGVWMLDEKAVTTFANPRMAEMLGYTAEEMLGRHLFSFMDEPGVQIAALELARRHHGIKEHHDFEFLRKDGTRICASLETAPITDAKGNYRGALAGVVDITENKQAESKLRDALAEAQRFREALDHVPAYIYIKDLQSRYIYANRQTLQLFGCSAEELAGCDDTRFFPPETAKRLQEIDSRAFQGEQTTEEIEIADAGVGRRVYWEVNIPIYAGPERKAIWGLLGISTDITGYKRAEEALRGSEVRFRELFNRMSSGVAMCEAVDDGRDFIIRDFNPAAEKIEKVSRKEIIGKRVSEVFTGVKEFGVFQVFQKVWQTGKAEYFPENIYKDDRNSGSWRENWVFKTPAGEVIAIYNDITERKQAQEEIKRQLAEKEILLKEVHHRMKNNVQSIGGLLSMHLHSATNPEAIAVLQDAIGRVNSMRILYDKLLLSEDYRDISVKSYVESLVDTVVALFPGAAKVAIDQRIADFQLDAKQLSPLGIIINELLTNIMKHAFINRESGAIKISLANVDGHVTLTVQDDGNGLPDGFDISESKGFGLILVKMLCNQLGGRLSGGRLSMESRAGTRCTVEFDI